MYKNNIKIITRQHKLQGKKFKSQKYNVFYYYKYLTFNINI